MRNAVPKRLQGIPGRFVKLRTFKEELGDRERRRGTPNFFRTTSADSQAWGEAEDVFKERMGVLTFAKSRAGLWRKRLKAKWLRRGGS
jgi:hypothetical protein